MIIVRIRARFGVMIRINVRVWVKIVIRSGLE